jgi:hypothetical protein
VKQPLHPIDTSALTNLLGTRGLQSTYDRFLALCEGPQDGLALLYVAEHLNRLFAESSAAFWPEVEPFQQWDALAQLIVDNGDDLLQKIGIHLRPAPKNNMVNGGPVPASPIYGRIGNHPLFAMLCADHEIPRRRVEYGSLQMQILHARWLEAEKVADQSDITPLEILQKEDRLISRICGQFPVRAAFQACDTWPFPSL